MSKSGKTREVDEALSGGSGEPRNMSMKYGNNPKDPAWRAEIAKRIRQKQEAARQLAYEANNVPPTPFTPLSVPPTPDQPGPSAKPNHCTMSSTPSTGADTISASGGGVGEDSFELHKRCLLEKDQEILTEASWTQLEEQFTHHLMQSVSVVHLLTRRALFWEEKEAEWDAKIKKVQADLKKAEEGLALATTQMKEGLAKFNEELAWKDQKLAILTKENDELKSSQKQQFELGKRKGREDFLQSNEFQSMLKKARQDGVCAFKKSSEFVVLNNAVDHVMAAFDTCQAQLQKLSGLNEGFDISQLDVIKSENSEDYTP